MKTTSVLATLAILTGAGPGLAQNRPSFDCAKARDDVEKAICRNAELSNLDREIAIVFGQLRRQLDPEAARALRQEQETFNASREVALGSRDTSLKDFMKGHLTLLRRIQAPSTATGAAAFLGEWGSPSGTVSIKPGKDGLFSVEINTAAMISARWVCEVSGEARMRDGRLSFKEDDVEIILSRKGQSMAIEEILPADHGRGYCGANGAVEGPYFKLRPGE
jgi:uncharacterized protein YecT (DUF1311 family)